MENVPLDRLCLLSCCFIHYPEKYPLLGETHIVAGWKCTLVEFVLPSNFCWERRIRSLLAVVSSGWFSFVYILWSAENTAWKNSVFATTVQTRHWPACTSHVPSRSLEHFPGLVGEILKMSSCSLTLAVSLLITFWFKRCLIMGVTSPYCCLENSCRAEQPFMAREFHSAVLCIYGKDGLVVKTSRGCVSTDANSFL